MTDAADNIGTTAVRAGFAFDEAALEQWMRANVPGYAGPLRVLQFRGGQSNPTYRLDTPGRRYVLRRKPPGVLLKGAHAVEREARVLAALGSIDYPVAHVHALCAEADVIGTPFYVMDLVEGRVFWDASFSDLPRGERAGYFEAMNTAIAGLHAINPAAVGLADYGRPGDYFARQIARWSGQYHADTQAGRNPDMDRLIDWLHANVPVGDDDTGIIHGDFRCDNIIFALTGPRILAVLDWELSTLGHRGADFAYHTMMYRMPPHIVAGLGGADVGALGLPNEQEYVTAYCRRRGLLGLPNYDFYVAFNFFRLAAIFHGIKGRVLRGSAASEQARQRVEVLPELMRLAWAQAEHVDGR